MNEKTGNEIFATLNRITSIIENDELLRSISHLVEISSAVVGGAVRDLVLDKPIKDIDIAISLNFYHNLKVHYSKRNDSVYDDDLMEANALDGRSNELLNFLGTEKFQAIHEKLFDNKSDEILNFLRTKKSLKKEATATSAVILLIEHAIKSNSDYTIEKKYDNVQGPSKPLKEVAYGSIGLDCVIAMKDTKCSYPVELLFTNNNVQRFMSLFDFNLCKIFMNNENGKMVINPLAEFTQDRENMTITYTPDPAITEAKMQKSLTTRYERLSKKMPEYKLTLDSSRVPKEMKFMVEQYVNIVRSYHNIKKLPEKTAPDNIKNNKL